MLFPCILRQRALRVGATRCPQWHSYFMPCSAILHLMALAHGIFPGGHGEDLSRLGVVQLISQRGRGGDCLRVSSDDGCLVVLATGQREELLQLPLQGLECGPVILVLLPAFKHNFVECRGTGGWTRHAVAMLHLVKHLGIRHACKTRYWWGRVIRGARDTV